MGGEWGGCIFYLHVLSTSVPCLIVGVKVFLQFLKWEAQIKTIFWNFCVFQWYTLGFLLLSHYYWKSPFGFCSVSNFVLIIFFFLKYVIHGQSRVVDKASKVIPKKKRFSNKKKWFAIPRKKVISAHSHKNCFNVHVHLIP